MKYPRVIIETRDVRVVANSNGSFTLENKSEDSMNAPSWRSMRTYIGPDAPWGTEGKHLSGFAASTIDESWFQILSVLAGKPQRRTRVIVAPVEEQVLETGKDFFDQNF
jgi:hypothetical protein